MLQHLINARYSFRRGNGPLNPPCGTWSHPVGLCSLQVSYLTGEQRRWLVQCKFQCLQNEAPHSLVFNRIGQSKRSFKLTCPQVSSPCVEEHFTTRTVEPNRMREVRVCDLDGPAEHRFD
ncbi:hypothetical protein RUM43_012412 [Polyplax serrata]|uniref:Uncharacterized protein n=1 Tax=Polyplax serrata TaxID=468196 RepID=A0AAN8NKM9_POLSC